jgi:hypothetical protein
LGGVTERIEDVTEGAALPVGSAMSDHLCVDIKSSISSIFENKEAQGAPAVSNDFFEDMRASGSPSTTRVFAKAKMQEEDVKELILRSRVFGYGVFRSIRKQNRR